MRPRMYGSSDRKWLRTSTWPSASAGTSVSTMRKLSVPGSPCGREASRTCLFIVMARSSVGSVEFLDLPAARGQRAQVLERAGGMRHQRVVRPADRAFAERQAAGAVEHLAVRHQAADAGP